MLVHAVREALGRHGAVRVLLLVGVVVALLLLSGSSSLGVRGLAGATTEEAANGMADGGANGNTTTLKNVLSANLPSFKKTSFLFSFALDARTIECPGWGGRVLKRKGIRSSASHLSKQSRALRCGCSASRCGTSRRGLARCLGGGRSVRSSRAGLLLGLGRC